MTALSAEVIVALSFSIPSLFLSAISVWLAYKSIREMRHQRIPHIETGAPAYNPGAALLPYGNTFELDGIDATRHREYTDTYPSGLPIRNNSESSMRTGMRRAMDVAMRYEEVMI